jgi:hypothetical protein
MLAFGLAGAASRDEYRSRTGLRDRALLVGVSQTCESPPGPTRR